MSDYFAIRIIDRKYQVGITTDGRNFYPIAKAVYDKPRDAVRYANMRQAKVSPLRETKQEGDSV